MGLLRAIRPWDTWIAGWGYNMADGEPDFDTPAHIRRSAPAIGENSGPLSGPAPVAGVGAVAAGSVGSMGRKRMVAFVRALISASQAASPHQAGAQRCERRPPQLDPEDEPIGVERTVATRTEQVEW